MLPLLKDVPGFDGIRIHSGNSAKTQRGVSLSVKTIRKDGLAILDYGLASSFRL